MRTIQVRGRDGTRTALVDDDVYEWAEAQTWRYDCGHAVNRNGAMHRQILGLQRGERRFVHHINQDGLDNRRANLLVCASMSECSSQPHPITDAVAEQARRVWAEARRVA